MFESLGSGKPIKNRIFNERALLLRQKLLAAQQELPSLDCPVIILVAGLDGAGKGSVAHRLNEWMDPRKIQSHAFWEPSDEENSRPYYWRYWRRLPDKGKIGIFFDAWYSSLMKKRMWGKSKSAQFSRQCQQITDFEKMLTDDGAVIVKLWLHISRETQYLQLCQDAPKKQQNLRVPVDAKRARKEYAKAVLAAQRMIEESESEHCTWQLIEAEDNNYRDLAAGEAILSALQRRAKSTVVKMGGEERRENTYPNALAAVDLTQALDSSTYKQKLNKYQAKLQDLAWQLHGHQRSVVAVFEGWDAAGKGSAIRRVTGAFDPRLYRVVQFSAPTDEERRHHYLWRFWRHLERDGRSSLFDRSWYGRVLVERVEEFASPEQWGRAYDEINQFEKQLTDHGNIVLKFWIHISPQEQLRRFKEREQQPHKQYKITDEDWRNRDNWGHYETAIDEMVAKTSTNYAPWTLVAGTNKRFARIQILQTFCHHMELALEQY
jgi:polyphosphate:AMP phosphotransferase